MNFLRYISYFSLLIWHLNANAQNVQNNGKLLKDVKSSCSVWFNIHSAEDSITWKGDCKNGYAEGEGTLTAFSNGRFSSEFKGTMKNGKPEGNGILNLGNNRQLSGNFSNGEFLNLSVEYLPHLKRNVVDQTDSLDLYVGDNHSKQLYYHSLIPEDTVRGVLVLMPGTWETTEHLISSTRELSELGFRNKLAILYLSINQRLTLNENILNVMNSMFDDAIKKYHLPKDKFIIGGFSMGGLFSLRYSEYAFQNDLNTSIKPVAVFSCDGPCDLENIYLNFKKKLSMFPDAGEPAYGIRELEKYCGGSLDSVSRNYVFYSCYSNKLKDGGNAKYLINLPVRIYCDVDPNWWIDNRGVDMYDMNALDQSAMILTLRRMGNERAEFINAFGKGYRIEGNRHPHSWSIIEPESCIKWINECLDKL